MKFYCSGTVFDETGYYHQPGFLYSRLKFDGGNFHLDRNKEVLAGSYVAVSDLSATNNIYHWVAETLASLIFLRSHGIYFPAIITVKDGLRKWQKESLELIGENNYITIEDSLDTFIVEEIVWKVGRELDRVKASNLRLLKSAFARLLTDIPRRRIYIKRRFPSPRSLENENLIEEAIKSFGFEIFQLELMSFSEQISLFSEAEMILGAHGAGLVHMIFAPKGCKIIEILPSDEIRTYFWMLSARMEHIYYFIRSEGNMQGMLKLDEGELTSTLKLAENL